MILTDLMITEAQLRKLWHFIAFEESGLPQHQYIVVAFGSPVSPENMQ